MNKPFVHSYSAGKQYEQCPQRFYQDRVLRKFPFVQSPEAAEGDRVHAALERAVRDNAPLPAEYRSLKSIVAAVRGRPGKHLVEQKWALRRDFEPTGYFAGDAYYRYRNDFASVDGDKAVCLDYKTGSDKYPDTEQLLEGAVVLMQHFPEVNTVSCGLVFTKTGKLVPETFDRQTLPRLLDKMAEKYATIDAAIDRHDYPRKSGPLCPWCPVTDCEFWRPKPEKRK